MIVVVLLALISTAAVASAQDFRGGITGRITDASGGRMPGVTVTATNVATNVASTTTTNGEGDYSILFLNPGTYAIVLGGSGQGEGIVANRIPGVRAAVYYGGALDIIRSTREHNDSNVPRSACAFAFCRAAWQMKRALLTGP